MLDTVLYRVLERKFSFVFDTEFHMLAQVILELTSECWECICEPPLLACLVFRMLRGMKSR